MEVTKENLSGGTRAETSHLPPCMNCGNKIGPGEPYREGVDKQGQPRACHATRLYFDECARTVRDTLREMGFCIADTLPEKTPDIVWLAEAGKNGWTVITQDARITRNPTEMQALINNKVKCFILPGRSMKPWDLVRGFVEMWDKIETESLYPGPFVWRLRDKSYASRWEQIHPAEPKFAPIDLSQTPEGHLLNLFADVVHLHDEGWFGPEFVNNMHENIRGELEARITGDRSRAMPVSMSEDWTHFGGFVLTGEEQEETLDQVMDLADLTTVVPTATLGPPEGPQSAFQWVLPAHKMGRYVEEPDGASPENTFRFRAFPTGFHRSGFGL